MCYSRESIERVLELLVLVYTEDLIGVCDMFDMQIEYKISLASFSQEFQTIIIMTIDKLLVNTLEDSSVHNL